ncbi:MAG: M15 family peptidase, partial [Spirochaetes bacterium]
MSLIYEQHAFLQDVARLVIFADQAGFIVTGGELWRTTEQQSIYVKTGRSKTMASNH